MHVQRPLLAASVVFLLLNATTAPGGDQQENPDLRGGSRPSRAQVPSSRTLGPAPHLAPITRFVTPIEPWVQTGLGWSDPALGDSGEPLCETNLLPESQCDPLGPRPFLHAGFDAQPAPDRSVRASAAGWVVAAHRSSAAFTGRRSAEGGGVVVLRHDMDGDPATGDDVLLTIYEHIEPLVSAGDVVEQGEVIARTSVIGGEHLHFGVRRATFDPDDPSLYHGILPPAGTTGCLPCFGRPLPLPAFPEHWEDPARLFRTFEWARLFAVGGDGAAGDAIETPGGYVAAGWTQIANIGGTGSTDMWILRLDPEGRILSQRAYGGPGGEQVRRLVPTADAGFVALAVSESFGPKVHAPLLLKFNAGEERPQWQRIYVASGRDWADDLKPTSDGGYVIAGATDPCACGGKTDATVVKVDSTGAVRWARSFRSSFVGSTAATSIVQTADGGYMVAGRAPIPVFGTDLLVFRLDPSGNLLWASSYGGLGDDLPGQIEAIGEGGFVIVGQTLPSRGGPERLWLLKIQGDGTVDWEATYAIQAGVHLFATGTRVALTPAGGYVVAGRIAAAGPLGEFKGWDLWILKLDSAGQILRGRTFDARGLADNTVGLRAARDGGFVLSGAGDGGCLLCGGIRDPSFLVVKANADLEVSSGCGTDTSAFRHPHASLVRPYPLQQADLAVAASPTDVAIVSTEASNHACEDGHYGPPPTFQSVSVEFFENHAVCDITGTLEANLCIQGIPGLRATSPVIIDATYDALALTAHVTDPDNTVERNDVVEVHAGLRQQGQDSEVPVMLLDDGSSTIFLESQRLPGIGEDCFYDRVSEVCGCKGARYPTSSGDAVAGDSRYTRDSGLFNFTQSPRGFDCALATRGRTPLLFGAGTSLDVSLRATDRQGNISTWPEPFRFTTGFHSVSCSGDACGCCLLFSPFPCADPDPEMRWERGGCLNLEGLVSSSGFPNGVCRDYLPLACGY